MAVLRRTLRKLGKMCRFGFAIVTPFVASNATVRNNQFVSLFFLLIIFLSCITLMVNGLVRVQTTLPQITVEHQYEYAIFVFVMLEVIYWMIFICRRGRVNCNWRAIKWRLSQDFGGFVCCADIPEYKQNHLQNHLLYGSFLIAMIISSYCFWLFTRSILLYTCSGDTTGLSFYAVVGDSLMSIALIFHIWLQLVVAFYFRKGRVTAVCHTLSAIIWVIALNFVLYMQITMSEAVEVKHHQEEQHMLQSNKHPEQESEQRLDPIERCRRMNATNIDLLESLEGHHAEWIRPLGYALTVEFVLTLNTVFFSLWYHALDSKDAANASMEEAADVEDIIEISIEPDDEEYAINHETFGQITLKPDRSFFELEGDHAGTTEVVQNHKILLDVSCRKLSLPVVNYRKADNTVALTRSATHSRNSNAINPDNSNTNPEKSHLNLDVFEPDMLLTLRNDRMDDEENNTPLSNNTRNTAGRKSQVSFASLSPIDEVCRRRWASMRTRRQSLAVKKDVRNIPFIGALVGAVVCTPLLVSAGFAYTISKKLHQKHEADQLEELAFSAKLYEAAIMITQAVMSFLFGLGLVILNKLTPSKRLKIHEKIDIILLLITMTGMMTLSSFAMSAIIYPWTDNFANQSKNLKIITGFEVLLGVVQVFLQTMFIAKAFATEATRHESTYVVIFGFRLQKRRLGKILTEVSMLFTVYSVLMWFINAFYERRSYSMLNRIATQFYPKDTWSAVTEVTYPMSICYYYHSMICFIAIINKFASHW